MDGTGVVLRCAPSAIWTKDAELTLVVDRERGSSWMLTGTEQVVWDLLTLGYSLEQLVEFASVFLGVSPEEADETILAICRAWVRAGLLYAEEGVASPEAVRERGETGLEREGR